CVKHIDSIAIQLEAGLDHVAAVGIGEVVIKLRHCGSKVLEGNGLPEISEHADRLICDSTAAKPEQGKTGRGDTRNPDSGPETPNRNLPFLNPFRRSNHPGQELVCDSYGSSPLGPTKQVLGHTCRTLPGLLGPISSTLGIQSYRV